ncbi:MAG: hypothetical protein CR217_12665 [Beijerinckiaceae bacterium]|nr:MAG: hypothetical protein CR217_12665 [Beijerinckiaceae bacterium]
MATASRAPFDRFISHPSALASCLAGALLLPAAALAAPPPTPIASPGFTVTVFAGPLIGSTAPDSIAIVGKHVWVGYGNGGAPDGSGGAMSQIVEYSSAGKVIRNLTVTGHNDGLRLDPTTHQLWALQNEDANPNLVVIDPATGFTVKYTFAAKPPHGGGYDDMVFIPAFGGRKAAVYVSASNPTLDAKGHSIGPSIVQATVLGSNMIAVTPVLSGTPNAVNIPFGTVSQLNLTDPDSMILTPSGDVLLDDQGDGQLVFLSAASATAPVRVLPLLGGVQVDDTVFATSNQGVLYVADLGANTIYKVTTPVWPLGGAFSAAAAVPATKTTPAFPAYVGQLDLTSGAVVPVVTNLMSPHGMAFVPQ